MGSRLALLGVLAGCAAEPEAPPPTGARQGVTLEFVDAPMGATAAYMADFLGLPLQVECARAHVGVTYVTDGSQPLDVGIAGVAAAIEQAGCVLDVQPDRVRLLDP